MNVLNRDTELERKVAESIIKLIKNQGAIDSMLNNESFVKAKMSEQFHDRIIASRNVINEFLEELCEKLNCSQDELSTLVTKSENIFEIAHEDIEKLINFMSKRKIIWKHILIGLGAVSVTALAVASGGAATPLAIALTSLGFGLTATALSIVIDRMLDNLNGFITSSRFEDIERAHNLYKQFLEYGEYPTYIKIKLYFEERFNNLFRTWKWEATKL